MIILHPVKTFLGLLLEDVKEYPKEWVVLIKDMILGIFRK